VKRSEIRYRATSTLLQVSGPLDLERLVEQCGVPAVDLLPVLQELVDEGQVVCIPAPAGDERPLVDPLPAQYCWAERWQQHAQQRVQRSQQAIQAAVAARAETPTEKLDVESEAATAFFRHVIDEYHPPRDKRFLVFLQCSIRRPFSTSPSHASIRRAIATATGYDPARDFERCPVHVVVLASKIGPVPYELENIYPANVRGSGVKHMDDRTYDRVKPILARRMAQYLIAHGSQYLRATTFTEGRYADVMEEARSIATAQRGEEAHFRILPRVGGPRIVRRGNTIPHRYWERYWIQLYLEIVSWLEPDQGQQAARRLEQLEVTVRG
jgi:hypothetical protein